MDTTAKADLDAGCITRTVLVRTSQQVAWDTLTDPAAIEAWVGHLAVFPDGMRQGRSFYTLSGVGHGLMPVRIERFDEPDNFDLLWGELGDEEPGETPPRAVRPGRGRP